LSLEYRGEALLALAGWHGRLRVTAVFDASADDRPVVPIRLRVNSAPGELSVAVSAQRPHRSLRKWWQERSVPPALRPWLPTVSDEQGRVLYVAGLGRIRHETDDAASPLMPLLFQFEPELPHDPRRPFVRSE
jgi:hypothetical protein